MVGEACCLMIVCVAVDLAGVLLEYVAPAVPGCAGLDLAAQVSFADCSSLSLFVNWSVSRALMRKVARWWMRAGRVS